MIVTETSPSGRMTFAIVFLVAMILTRLTIADKLSADTRAPLFAQGAGGLRLEPPFEGPVKTHAPVTREEINHPNIGNGEYSFSFETEDGIQREEVGTLKKVGNELVTVVKGRYSYKSPEGLAIDVRYSADENGAVSSFTFGTDPGKWKQSLSLLPGNNDKGKFISRVKGSDEVREAGRGYLPPSRPIKLNNEYLPSKSSSSSSTR